MFRRFEQGGIRTPEEFQTKYMGRWNVSSPITPTRPCTVDGTPARFHRFVDNDRVVLQINRFCRPSEVENILNNFNVNNFTGPDCELHRFRQTRALIEWPDGRLSKVALEQIQFKDGEDFQNE